MKLTIVIENQDGPVDADAVTAAINAIPDHQARTWATGDHVIAQKAIDHARERLVSALNLLPVAGLAEGD